MREKDLAIVKANQPAVQSLNIPKDATSKRLISDALRRMLELDIDPFALDLRSATIADRIAIRMIKISLSDNETTKNVIEVIELILRYIEGTPRTIEIDSDNQNESQVTFARAVLPEKNTPQNGQSLMSPRASQDKKR